MGTSCLQALRILTLEPEHLKNRSTTPRTRVIGDGKGSYPRRSSGLLVQFVDVEVFSLLPRVSPREGICLSWAVMACLRLSASSSRRACWRKCCSMSSC